MKISGIKENPTTWETSDGSIFHSKLRAQQHARKLGVEKDLQKLTGAIIIGVSYFPEGGGSYSISLEDGRTIYISSSGEAAYTIFGIVG